MKKILFSSLFFIFMIFGCTMNNSSEMSTDIEALRKLIQIDFTVSEVKWEMYNTPEYSGGVPGPTDFVTLIAELSSTDSQWFSKLPESSASQYITPNAARSWLSPASHKLMSNNENSTMDISASGCRIYRTKMTKSGLPVDCIVCKANSKVLLYLNIITPEN